jgi:Flp pilus assembly protein TadD
MLLVFFKMGMSMTLRQICVLIACDSGRPYKSVKAAVDALLAAVGDGLRAGERVGLSPLGALVVRHGRVRFRPSASLKGAVADAGPPRGRHHAAVERSRGYADVGQWDAAIRILERLLQRGRSVPELHHEIAVLHLRKGQKAKACTHLEVAGEEQSPKGVQLNVGRTWLSIGRPERAEEIFLRLLQQEGESRGALVGLALVHLKRGLYHEAVSSLRKALQLDSEDPEVHFQLGVAYHHLERHEEAVEHLEEAREREPENPKVVWHLGLLYDHLGRTHEAQSMYRRHRELQDRD